LHIALRALTRHRLRSALATLGISIGVGVSGDLKLYQYRRFENGRFSSWHP